MATLWVPLLATAVLPLPPPLLTLAFCRQVPTIPTYPNHQTFTSLLRWSGCLIPPPNNQPRFIARAILLFAESIGSLIATFTRLCRVVCIVHVRIFANVRTRTHCLRIFETQMIHSLPFFFFFNFNVRIASIRYSRSNDRFPHLRTPRASIFAE